MIIILMIMVSGVEVAAVLMVLGTAVLVVNAARNSDSDTHTARKRLLVAMIMTRQGDTSVTELRQR